MNFELFTTTILLPIISFTSAIIIAILSLLIQRKNDKIKIIENQLSLNKYKAYGELVAIFYDLLKNIKVNKKGHDEEHLLRLIDSKKDLFIYGSDEVFKKFTEWLVFTGKYKNNNRHLKIFLDMLILIRKDMGNGSTKLTRRDILLSLTQNEDDYENFKKYLQ